MPLHVPAVVLIDRGILLVLLLGPLLVLEHFKTVLSTVKLGLATEVALLGFPEVRALPEIASDALPCLLCGTLHVKVYRQECGIHMLLSLFILLQAGAACF